MPIITLPDGTQKTFSVPVTVEEVAKSIGAGLAKAAIAGVVNEQLVDIHYRIEQDAKLKIITERDPAGVDIIRHSAAHLLAQAVQQLFPSAKVTIGPVIEEGFYYDFSFERPFTPDDLVKIEERMHAIAKQDLPVSRRLMNRDEAIQFFEKLGENYKVEIIRDIPNTEPLSFYQQGDFVDLCRGPHVPRTSFLKVFKLTKLAGAYWRGNPNNEMLQRIYGTAWANKKDLDDYLTRIEEAEKRDHRKLGKALQLFHTQEDAPGMVFWHPNGWQIWQVVENYMRSKFVEHQYQEIRTPQILNLSLWKKSGHWEKFNDDMFTLEIDEVRSAVKPMSCPCHIQVFNQGLKSYRELPIRFAEFGCCHRNEASGALHGLFRTRGFTQDDAHIFCTEDQIQSEVSRFIKMVYEVYQDFGFDDVLVKLSTRPEKRVGSDEVWDKAEKSLANALNASKLDWQEMPGEGAFYGPKIEFVLRDCIGRLWTTGSIQLDFSMPARLGAEYVSEDNQRKVPVMLHRAIYGSLERFIGILIEHNAGILPVWLAPTQVAIMTISDKQAEYVLKTAENLRKLGLRVKTDLRNEKIGYKIREQTLQKIPYQLIVGEKEIETETVSVRTRGGNDLGQMSVTAFSELIAGKLALRGRSNVED